MNTERLSTWLLRTLPTIRRGRASLPTWLVAVVDFLLLNGAFVLAFWMRFDLNLAFTTYPRPEFAGYIKALMAINYCCLFLFITQGLYQRERFHSGLEEYNTILKGLTGSLFFVASLTFFVRGFEYSRLVCVYAWGLSAVGFAGFRYMLWQWERHLRSNERLQFRSVIIGASETAQALAAKFRSKPALGHHIIGFIDTGQTSSTVPTLGGLERFSEILLEQEATSVFIADPSIEHYRLLELVEHCERTGVTITMVPSLYDLLVTYRDMSNLDGIPLVSLAENSISDISQAIKRAFDIGFSLLVLALTWPFWVLMAILIRLDSPGPVFFVQERAGKNGLPFAMLKFRTMVQDAEERLKDLINADALSEPVFKLQNDPRVTRTGKFLREWSLDELPQFLNVLWGNMSVVGPRPEEVGMVGRYNVWQRRRLKVKPGITGLQQITNRGCDSLSDRVKYDIYYIRQYSLLLDVKIILLTVWVVFLRRGTH